MSKGTHRSGSLQFVRPALSRLLHLLVPAAVALCAGVAVQWTVLQTLAFAWALVLLWHTILRWTDSEVFSLLRNPWSGLVVSAAFGALVWVSFFVTGLSGGPSVHPMFDQGGIQGPNLDVRVVSLLIVVAPAIPYAFDTLAALFGLRDD